MTKQRAIRTLATIISLLIVGFVYDFSQKQSGSQTITSAPPGYYYVTTFSDGDTFTVDMNGQEERIRLIGVDTPETHKPNSPIQCFGPEASQFTKMFVGKQSVRLEADPVSSNRDRYDRLLRYAYTQDGTLLNDKLIRQGYGFAYLIFPFSKHADFAAAQAEAQNAKRGLWGTCETKLNDGRWRSNDIQ